jgi:zinc D-Ala-D-Ala carboxypeptidase
MQPQRPRGHGYHRGPMLRTREACEKNHRPHPYRVRKTGEGEPSQIVRALRSSGEGRGGAGSTFPRASALLCLLLFAACATTPPAPTPVPVVPAPEAPTAPAPPDASAPTDTAVEAPPAIPPTPARLPWVNPARCLTPCNFTPPALLTVDDAGAVAPAGKHQVDAPAQPGLAALIAAARAAGHEVRIISAYRSYEVQSKVFRTIKEKGRAARPGHSEHQLGSAIDLRLPTGAAIAWLNAEAARFGFAVSYPPGKQKLTGYRPEPWHIRFVGREAATEIASRGLSVEEYLRANPDRGDSGNCSDCPAPASRAACGKVTATGLCRGTVLTWCYEGALATVDCKVSEEICSVDSATGEPGCVAPKQP